MTRVRTVRRTDIPKVMGLYKRAIVPVWEEIGRDYDLQVIEGNILARIDDHNYHMMVLVDDATGAITGYLAWERHADHTSNHLIAHLRMMMVDPSIQRLGFASTLMDYFEMSAKEAGCTKVLFDVIVGSSARCFYDSRGYVHWSNFMEKRL